MPADAGHVAVVAAATAETPETTESGDCIEPKGYTEGWGGGGAAVRGTARASKLRVD